MAKTRTSFAFGVELTDAQWNRRAEQLKRKHARKVAQIERKQRRAAKHSFDFASKF